MTQLAYILASKKHILDIETYEFIELRGQHIKREVQVPIYFWNTTENFLKVAESQLRLVESVQLKDLYVKMVSYSRDDSWTVELRFYDKLLKSFVLLRVFADPRYSAIYHNGYATESVNYEFVSADGRYRHDVSVLHNLSWGTPRFQFIDDLARKSVPNTVLDGFQFGLQARQYGVGYKGKRLSGKCYAFLCGTFAILLTDDLSFDALAYLDGATYDTLAVERFVYTTSPYITKVMTLMR